MANTTIQFSDTRPYGWCTTPQYAQGGDSFCVNVLANDDSGIDHVTISTSQGFSTSSFNYTFIEGTTQAWDYNSSINSSAVSSPTNITVTATAYAKDGSTASASTTVELRPAPSVSIASIPSSVHEANTFNVSVTASSNVSGVSISSIDVSINGTTQTINGSSGTVTLTAPHTSGSNTTFSVIATVHASDGGHNSTSKNITVIESVPTVSITSCPSSVQERNTFTVSVSASDDSGIDHTDVTYNGTTKTVSGSSGSTSFTAQSVSGSSTSATISVTTHAKDGGTATTSKTITITEEAPTVSITSIPSSVQERNTFSVSASASDDSGIDHIDISISGSSATVNGSSGTATLTAPSVNGSNTPFTVTAKAYAKDGGTATATASITIKESAPTVSITSLPSSVNESTPSNPSTFSISASASDDSGIDHIDVSISGSSAKISGASGSATLTAPSTNGSNTVFTVTVIAHSKDGGTATATHSITVIEHKPTVTINNYPSSVVEGRTFSVKASGSDDSGIAHISYTFNGSTKTGSSGSYVSFTAPRTSGSNKNYTMTITAHANDGGTASTSRTITIVEIQASITSCTYKNKARSGGKLSITVNATDDSGIDHIAIDYHGTTYTGSNNTPITIKCIRTNKKITDSFTAKAVAKDGNTASTTYSFTLLPGMSLDKLFVARYIGLDTTRIIFGGGPMVLLGKKLIGGGRLI